MFQNQLNMKRSPQNIFLTLKKEINQSQIRKNLSSDNCREYTNPKEIMNELKAFIYHYILDGVQILRVNAYHIFIL